MFEFASILLISALVFGMVSDEELVRLVNTVANLFTIVLLIWHQRHVKVTQQKVEETETVVKRTLGERNGEDEDYTGPERRSK